MLLVTLEWKVSQFVHKQVPPVFYNLYIVGQAAQDTDSLVESSVQKTFGGELLGPSSVKTKGSRTRGRLWMEVQGYKSASQNPMGNCNWNGSSKMSQVKARQPDLIQRQVTGHGLSLGRRYKLSSAKDNPGEELSCVSKQELNAGPQSRNWDLGQSTENNISFNNEPLLLTLVLLIINILFQSF